MNKQKKAKLLITVILFFVFSFGISNAITLDKAFYYDGQAITANGGESAVLYNNTPADPEHDIYSHDYPIFYAISYPPNWVINFYNEDNPDAPYMGLDLGNYSIIELRGTDLSCYYQSLSYQDCKNSPDFVNEAVFDIRYNPYGSGGEEGGGHFDPGQHPELDPGLKPAVIYKSRIQNYLPIISIINPKINSIFSSLMSIDYSVTDKDDTGSADAKSHYGLVNSPVSLFYSDKISEWFNQLINPSDKNIIAKDLPAIGKYSWSVKDLIPGVLYRVIVDAVENSGRLTENVSDYFSVDFTQPVFSISTDPAAVRGGDVKISVDSSEKLSKAPDVSVAQNNNQPLSVQMTGEGSHFEGTYTVVSGFDGTAKVLVSGTDEAGNVGTTTISGGTFSVGINPPPKPILNASSTKLVVTEQNFSISGKVREDTKVALLLNGSEVASTSPNAKGEFSFTGIKLDKIKNKGLNYIGVISRDSFDAVSETATLEVKYNIAPTAQIVSPVNKDLLKDQTVIKVSATDANQDILYYTYQITTLDNFNSTAQDKKWVTIEENSTSNNFNWVTSEMEDGDYMIQVIISDGNAQAVTVPIQVTLNNVLPFFRFEDGRKTVINQSHVIISGKAMVSNKIYPAPYIESVAYSMDGGDTWTPVAIAKGQYPEQKFSVEFTDLEEGSYPIVWWTKDSRKIIGKTVHTIVVDKTAPKAPEITVPRILDGSVLITDADDVNQKLSGVQINISGFSEPSVTVFLTGFDKTLSTKTLPTGEFTFSDVTVTKKGSQKIGLYSVDEAKNMGAPTVVNLTYNNPPQITFINPKPFRGLSGKAVLSWNITDVDNDLINNVEISYRIVGETFKKLLSDAPAKGTYTWDTTNLPESNQYELRITATDSISPVSSVASFFIDRTPPVLSYFSINKVITDKKVNISGMGTSTDSVSGIEYVEYSIKAFDDAERSPWYKGIITKGYLQKQASFEIKYPNDLADSSYTVYARAVDAAGNVSGELSQNIYIDRTPPRVGSFFIEKKNLNLIPDENGNISYYKNSIFTFSVSIEKDTKLASLIVGEDRIQLNKNVTSGLWEATSTIATSSVQDISISAEDDSGNVVENKKIGSLTGIESGKVVMNSGDVETPINNVIIRISKLNDGTGQYDKFNPSTNDTSSIVETDQYGYYELVLPAGTYHLSAVKSGYKVDRKDIVLSRTEIINKSFVVSRLSIIMRAITDILNSWFY